MRTMIFLLLVTFLPLKSVFPCDIPPQSSADDKVTTDSEPLVWPPKPEKALLHGMWLAPAGDARQTLLWLRDDGSWTTASVLGKTESVDSLEAVVTAQDPWHIDRLDDKAASYVLVLGQPRPTRCGPGSTHAPTYAINRVTATRLVLQQSGQTSDQSVYHRADPALAAKIRRRIDEADAAAKSRIPRSAESMADGVYAVHYEGQGKTVRRTDGGEIILAERLTDRFGEASMYSVANDNSRFALNLKGAGPIPAKRTAPYFAVILDGYVLAVAGHSDPHPDATMDLGVQVFGAEAAKVVEERLKVAARRRSHPGHRLLTTWIPAKGSYRVNEPVTLRLAIKNVGDKAVSFRIGGQQRGPRDNQFHFLAYRSGGHGKAVPDTGDPTNFGGISSWRDLKPGEVFSQDVNLSHWFTFTEPDGYRITGVYELEHFEVKPDASHSDTIWEDFAVGECTVYVEGAAPAK